MTDLSIYAVTTLAEFYGVTTDYLLGVTENKKRPDAVHSDLHLSDGAVDVLRNGNCNHRMLCELLEHPDFSRCMTDLEIDVYKRQLLYGPLVKRLRQRPLTPLTSVRFRYGSPNSSLAQLVEQLTLNQWAQGSSPWRCTKF